MHGGSLQLLLLLRVFDFQEPAPMTEDLLEEQSEVLAKLGTSAEGTHLRARMQSACLLSDMESFKVTHTHTHIQNLSSEPVTLFLEAFSFDLLPLTQKK